MIDDGAEEGGSDGDDVEAFVVATLLLTVTGPRCCSVTPTVDEVDNEADEGGGGGGVAP